MSIPNEVIMDQKLIIKKIEKFVKEELFEDSTGHDWWHSHRVRQLGLRISEKENADIFTVEAAALLHDIGDYKFHDGDEEICGTIVEKCLKNAGVIPKKIVQIVHIVTNNSFIKSLKNNKSTMSPDLTIEEKILNDADRLDAMGAIGIARAFAFGGFFKREIHNPTIPPNIDITYEEYKEKNTTSINHFYEKLLKLKDTMLTKTGETIAQKRHEYLENYLNHFFDEWNGLK